jgi:hypothetical protein
VAQKDIDQLPGHTERLSRGKPTRGYLGKAHNSKREGEGRMKRIKSVALVLTCVTIGLLAFSAKEAKAEVSGRLDECSVTCQYGGCNASTPWWQFWNDCLCGCGPGGQASCSCGY